VREVSSMGYDAEPPEGSAGFGRELS